MSAVPISALPVSAGPATFLPVGAGPADAVETWCDRADPDLADIMLDLAFDEVLLRRASALRSRPLPATLREFLGV